ncbi:MAG: PEGA domain-containing protein, partial [Sandaracinaceae bacterium]
DDEPAPPQDVTHRVISEPAGAEVVLDGEVIGEAPLAVTRPGDVASLEITLRLRGHVEQTISVTEESPEEVVVTLPRRRSGHRVDPVGAPALAPR